MPLKLTATFREAHRLRVHLRNLRGEIENLPRAKKAHQAKVAKQELASKDAHEAVKRLKAANHDREVNLKSTFQQLTKYERQLNDMTTPKEVAAMQSEIAEAKKHIAELEEEILNGMTHIEEEAAKVPAVDELLKKSKAQLATFEADMKEREGRLLNEVKLAEEELKKVELDLPALIRPHYDRLVNGHGPDAMAVVKAKDRICSNCLTAVTAQMINELLKDNFLCCNNCGRMLYLAEIPAE